MSTTYLPTNPHQSDNLQANIQSLRAQLQLSRAEQKRCQIQLNALQSMRSRISASLEELSAGYKKEIKSLEQKVKRLEIENKQLMKQNALYEMQVKNFEKRVLQKDSIISTILAKEFFVPVRGIAQERSREVVTQVKQNEKVDKEIGRIEGQGQGFRKSIALLEKNDSRILQSKQKRNSNLDNIHKYSLSNKQQLSQKTVDIEKKETAQIRIQQPIDNQHYHDQPITEINKLSPIKKSVEEQSVNKESQTEQISENQKGINIVQSQITTNNHQDNIKKQQQTNPIFFFPTQADQLQQKTTTFQTQSFEKKDLLQTQPILKNVPPPKKKGPIQSVKTMKKTVTKNPKTIPKYKPLQMYDDVEFMGQLPQAQEQFHLSGLNTNNIERQDAILGQFQMTRDYYQASVKKEGQKNQQQQELQEKQVVGRDEEIKQPLYVVQEQTEQSLEKYSAAANFTNDQHEKNLQKQDISHGSIAKSKKSKRQKPRPVEHQVINFEDDIIPVTQTTQNSSNFFDTLVTHQNPLPSNNLPHYNNQEDHQMHGLVDQSSIEQIDDHSMISNPIFPEDNDLERIGNEQVKRRKGSTDKFVMANDAVIKPAPSKKMSKKKAKRETVEVMDPSSFV